MILTRFTGFNGKDHCLIASTSYALTYPPSITPEIWVEFYTGKYMHDCSGYASKKTELKKA